MKTISSVETKNAFDEAVKKSQQQERLHQRLDRALEEVKAGRIADGPEFLETMGKQYFDPNV